MSARAMAAARLVLGPITRIDAGAKCTGTLHSLEGRMVEARSLPLPQGATVDIETGVNKFVRGEVVGFRGTSSLIFPFGNECNFTHGAKVNASLDGQQAQCGPDILGRIIDAQGQPLDGRRAIHSHHRWPLHGRESNPLHRARITQKLDLGVRGINALLTAGRGQRIAVIAGSGVGKSVLMGQMLSGAECDVVVVGLIGERSREISDFVAARKSSGFMDRTVVVAEAADRAPILRIRAAMRATAIAEYFRDKGKHVFLLIDSMTRIAHAQREIGLSLGEPPTMKGYPPSALGLLPALVERAGGDTATGGSITAIYTVLADGDDNDDPVVDTARSIVDGHIILSRELAEQGIFPALDLSKSLSRIMPEIVDHDHLGAARHFRRLWSAYQDNRDLLMLGAYVAGNDPILDEAIARRGIMLSFIHQNREDRITYEQSRNMLIEGFQA